MGGSKGILDSNYSNLQWQKVKIGDLFNIHPTSSYGYTNSTLFKTKGKVPVVVNSSLSNGIGGYVDLPPTEKGNMITYSDTTTSDAIFINQITL
ncbi:MULTISPECIES: restriction endonuclease subunit S [unclassified Campylobacter]|uniref:restriction endonuclease subunit S n=1 Tax=unclassified Campylobacter TaxID=2593542 RepID=UPI0029588B09|nr:MULTISPECIES: restriction endonuclease subunit S [unclassified Campylobacter]